MERKFVPLTREQVDAAIRGDLKLVTICGLNVESLRREGSLLIVFFKENDYIYTYQEKGNHCYVDDSIFDLCIDTTLTPKTVKVNETVMGLKEALIFISNMITEQ